MGTSRQNFTTPAGLDLDGAWPAACETLAEEIERFVLQRYDDTSHRDAVATAPDHGEICVTLDTDTTWFYNGAAWLPLAASGTYAPTLTGMAVGTGSPTNTADYTYLGSTGGFGILKVSGRIRFGSSGATFPTAPTIALPAGYTIANYVAGMQCTHFVRLVDTGTAGFPGVAAPASSTTIALSGLTASGTYVGEVAISTTVPYTWVATDGIDYAYELRVTV